MYDEIRQFREACGDAHMKSILAIGELGTFTNVYKASLVAMMAGTSHHRLTVTQQPALTWFSVAHSHSLDCVLNTDRLFLW